MYSQNKKVLRQQLLTDGQISFIAHNRIVKSHNYSCYKICISLNEAFSCSLQNKQYDNIKAFILGIDILNSLDAANSDVLVVCIDCESALGQLVEKKLAGNPFIILENDWATELASVFCKGNFKNQSIPELVESTNTLIFSILPDDDMEYANINKRVKKLLDYIDEHLEDRLRLEDLANLLNLSVDRTRHLFPLYLKVSFAQYVLWKKIKKIFVQRFTNDSTFAAECIKYGFTDQSHFTRIFLRMFGTPPAAVIKNCTIIQ